MYPLGKIPVNLKLGNYEYHDELHIYPNISGTLLSWKACVGLGILPSCYSNPITPTQQSIKQITKLSNNLPAPEPLTLDNIRKEFPNIFDGQVRTMRGEEFHILLTNDAKPFCINTPRSIPFIYHDRLKEELELLQRQNIIAPITEATQWCAPIVVTPKKHSDNIRMCVDLLHINCYVQRERYQSPTPAEAIADIAATKAKYFTVLDAMKGYHQCPIDADSQLLTMFITPFRRFKYLHAPYGISSISKHYNRRMAEALEGLPEFCRIVDDIIIYDSTIKDHAHHVRQFLQRCTEKQIALNPQKCKFAGFHLSSEGYQVISQ